MSSTIQQIKELPADALIYAVTGTIKKLHPQKTGTNTNGYWAIQRGVLTQPGGQEIEFMLKDRDALHASNQGREVTFEAFKGEKGWSGCYAKDDTFKDVTKRIITLTPTGTITYMSGGQAHQPPANEPPPQRQQSQTTQRPAEPPANTQPAQKPAAEMPQKPSANASFNEAMVAASQIANCQLMCLSMVENYVGPRFKAKNKRELSSEEKHAWSMNMMIELCRNGHQWRMPSVMLKDKPEAPPPPPANADPHAVQANEFTF